MSVGMKGIAGAAAAITALALGTVAAAHTTTRTEAPTAASARAASVHAGAKAAEAKAALLRYLKNSKPRVLVIRRSGLQPGQKANISKTSTLNQTVTFNWSGYASSSTTKQEYSAVYGGWTVPKAFCSQEDELSSEWVGLDGFSTNTVEQDGTLDWCFEGTAFYYTWYEMYPNATVSVGSSVLPGDKITAKVTRSGTNYTMAVTDSTTPVNSFSTVQSCPAATCLDESAEWIDERPAFQIGVAPLAPTTSWTLTGGSTTAGGVSDTIAAAPSSGSVEDWDATQSYQLDTVGALAVSGKQFTTKFVNSY